MRCVSLFLFLLAFIAQADAAVFSANWISQPSGSVVNLSAQGAYDWIHLGANGTNATRKIATPVFSGLNVSSGTLLLPVTNSVGFSWSDGSPTTAANNIVNGLGITALSNSIATSFSPGSTAIRKLRIYAGAYAADAEIQLSVNDGVTSPVSFPLMGAGAPANGVLLVDLALTSASNQVLVRLSNTAVYASGGYVSLQAVSLTTNTAPSAVLNAPLAETSLPLGAVATLSAGALDSDGEVVLSEFFVDGIKVGESGTMPWEVSWTPTNVGPRVLTVRVTDNNGAQTTSAPVQLFVTSSTGGIVASVQSAASSVNLTSEGTSDWVHWGLYTESTVNRKSAVAPQIGPLIFDGPAYTFWDSASAYSWTDGQPALVESGTTTGVYIVGLGSGFRLSLPADTTPRTAKLYVGTYGARGKLVASLGDYSAPVVIDRSVNNTENGPASVYTLNYVAGTTGQVLNVSFTVDQMHNLQYGNVTFQAATLISAANPLFIALAAPTNNTIVPAPANVTFQASLTGGDGMPRTVGFYNGNTKLGEDNAPPYDFTLSNALPGVYQITARTTNNFGQVQTSDPVRVFVKGSTGLLTGSFNTSSGSVNLSTEGTRDWSHWGLVRKNSVNRKSNVSPQISALTQFGNGPSDRYDDNLVFFNWTDGTPTVSQAGTRTGIYASGLGSGFQITVPADRTLRRLKVYVGLFAARGNFEAILSDSSAGPYLHSTFENVYNNAAGVHTIDFAAGSAGQTLTVRYTSKLLFDEQWGNVTFQAATLSELPLAISGFNQTSGAAGFNFLGHAGWNYVIEASGAFPPNWIPIANFVGNGSVISFVDPAMVSSTTNRFYRIRMQK